MSVSVFWSLCQSHCMEVSHVCQSVYFGHYVSHIVWRSVTYVSQCILVTMSVTLCGGQSPMSVYFGHYVSHIVWRSVTYVSVFWSLCQSHCMEVSHLC